MNDLKLPSRGSCVMCVDPGSSGGGIAVWNSWTDGPRGPDTVYQLRGGGKTWAGNFTEVLSQYDTIRFQEGPEILYVEDVSLWLGSAKSQGAAARGSLFKLAYLVGALVGSAATLGLTWYLVSSRWWKGQMGDRAVKARLKRVLGQIPPSYLRPHVHDAVGMGLALQRCFA